MKHLLAIQELERNKLLTLLENAQGMVEISRREVKKVPALRGKTVINLFYEASTRTRTSFEIAGKWLSADVINITSGSSSASKGETLLDTALTLQAMAPDILVVRHGASGAPEFLSQHLKDCAVVNAGDGTHEHPTQALLDLLTLRQHLGAQGLEGLCVAIVGDIRHSRVARSNMWAHLLLGNEVRLVGPPTLVPLEFNQMAEELKNNRKLQTRYPGKLVIEHALSAGLREADVVIALRMQLERQEHFFVPSLEEYSRNYCVSSRSMQHAGKGAVVLSPGPANRGIEISGELLDSPRCLAANQVTNGIAVRMAVLYELASARAAEQHIVG